jgi:hypothetical protein
MKKIIALAFSLCFLHSTSLFAQTFFYKESSSQPDKLTQVKLDFSIGQDSVIQLKNPAAFSPFKSPKSPVTDQKISRRPISEAEQALQVGLWLITGLVVLASQDVYDLGGDLKLLSMRGLLFFVFPFEFNDLYRHCGNDDLLIAVSSSPTPDELKRMKPLDEVHKLCDSVDKDEKPKANDS